MLKIFIIIIKYFFIIFRVYMRQLIISGIITTIFYYLFFVLFLYGFWLSLLIVYLYDVLILHPVLCVCRLQECWTTKKSNKLF